MIKVFCSELHWSRSCFVLFVTCLPGSQISYVQIPKALVPKREISNTFPEQEAFLFNQYSNNYLMVGYVLRPGDILGNKKHSILYLPSWNL